MEKQLEYFDVVTNAQKQVFNNLLATQKDLRAQWMEAVGKTYTAFTSITGLPETAQTREALNQFSIWFGTVANNSKSATEEALKTSENWISSYEKQVAMSRGILKNLIDTTSPIIAIAKLA